jgi:hypothetical protein
VAGRETQAIDAYERGIAAAQIHGDRQDGQRNDGSPATGSSNCGAAVDRAGGGESAVKPSLLAGPRGGA